MKFLHPETVGHFFSGYMDNIIILNFLIDENSIANHILNIADFSDTSKLYKVAFCEFKKLKALEVESKALQNFTKMPFDERQSY